MNNTTCPSCRTPNQPGAKFCLNCGTGLGNTSDTPYQAPHSNPANQNFAMDYIYAGFWKRFFAYILDGIILSVIYFSLTLLFSGSIIGSMARPSPEAVIGIAGLFYLGIYIVWWLYFAIQESSSAQATLGKRALGIKVTDIQGYPLSFAHAAGRQLAGVVTQLTFTIGYLMAAFTGRKQALHDLIAGCVVVNKNFDSTQVRSANQSPPAGMSVGSIIGIILLVLIIPVGGILAAIALPAYQDYTIRAKVSEAHTLASTAKPAIIQYATKTGYWPVNFEQAELSTEKMRTDDYFVQLIEDGVLEIRFIRPQTISGGSLYLKPDMSGTGEYQWQCFAENIKSSYLMPACR